MQDNIVKGNKVECEVPKYSMIYQEVKLSPLYWLFFHMHTKNVLTPTKSKNDFKI